jgi:hypothetical protein
MNTFDNNRLGSLLDFADAPARLDLGAIVRAGRRRRHQKRLVIAGAGAVTLAAGGLTAEVLTRSAGNNHPPSITTRPLDSPSGAPAQPRALPATVTQSEDLVSDFPPIGGSMTTMASSADGWRAVAYVDSAGDMCFGSVDASGASRGACAPTDAFGNAPAVDNATGPDVSAAATAPASEAPSAAEIGVFGMVSIAATEPSNFQHVARVTVDAGGASIDATLSPTAAAMGSTTRLAADQRVWFAWVPSDVRGGALTVSSYTSDDDFTSSQPVWLTPNDFIASQTSPAQ